VLYQLSYVGGGRSASLSAGRVILDVRANAPPVGPQGLAVRLTIAT
jgi:hypothetical protein